MFSALQRQQKLMSAKPSLLSVSNAFLDPLLIVLTLLAVALQAGENFDRNYVILALIVFSLSFPGEARHEKSLRGATLDIAIGWAGIVTILFCFAYVSEYLDAFPRHVIVAWVVLTPVMMFLGHCLLRHSMRHLLPGGNSRRKAVIAGMGELGVRLAREIQASPYLGIELAGFFDDRSPDRLGAVDHLPLIGRIDTLSIYARENRLDTIYIALPMATQPRILRLLDDLRDTTVSINFVPDIFVTDLIQGHVDSINGIPVVGVCDTPFSGVNGIVKRGSDIVLSIIILILISPIMLAIAIGVKMTSPGPVLFVQRRYGLDGKDIYVYKFRSMSVCENGDQIKQATRNDNRITPLGAILRKTSLDELPQFFNVLQGRMSIVGPRPHAVAHNEMYRKLIKGYMVRHKVKPGITGWAQINGHRGETELLEKMEARIEFDLDYLRNWSLKLDLAIIAKTVLVVVNDKQAY
jgi:putative colanic acid biosynthesis UDP-glucose lipid carrier transferase